MSLNKYWYISLTFKYSQTNMSESSQGQVIILRITKEGRQYRTLH